MCTVTPAQAAAAGRPGSLAQALPSSLKNFIKAFIHPTEVPEEVVAGAEGFMCGGGRRARSEVGIAVI